MNGSFIYCYKNSAYGAAIREKKRPQIRLETELEVMILSITAHGFM